MNELKTKIDVSFTDFFKISLISGSIYKILMMIGHITQKSIKLHAMFQEGRTTSQNGVMTKEAVEHARLRCENLSKSGIIERQVPFSKDEIENPKDWQAFGAQLLLNVLSEYRPYVHSALNIGSYNDRHFSYMARKFPEIKFVSVDFMSEEKMREFNELLPQSPNWILKSGYPLSLMLDGEVSGDLIFLSSTSLLFNNKELDLYLDVISQKSKVIVINEGWGIVSNSDRLGSFSILPRIIRPEDIPENEPAIRSMDGVYFSYGHNYPAKLEKRGFVVTQSCIRSSNNPSLYLYQLVAVKKDISSSSEAC